MTPLFDPDRRIGPAAGCRPHLTGAAIAELAGSVAGTAAAEGLTTVDRAGRRVPYPMLPSLVQLDIEAERHLAGAVPLLFGALQKIVRAHRCRDDLREFLDVPATLRPWVDASPVEDYRIDFCRFDLVGASVQTARVVEFNANCPGGTIFTGAYGALWRSVPPVGRVLTDWGTSEAVIERRHWFPQLVLEATGHAPADAGIAGPIALFRKPGGNTLELAKIDSLFGEIGWRTVTTDPSGEDWIRDELQIGYLKYGVQPTLADIGGWETFLRRLIDRKLRIVNPVAGRWIGDNKLCLAVMSDPRFAGLFTAAELDAAARLIPASRKVGDGVEPAELIADPRSWVIKGPYDTRGNSVYVGVEQDRSAWRGVVDRAAREGWLAQEMIEPAVVQWQGAPHYEDLSVVLLQGRWAGYTSRVSPNLRVNVAQGGGRQVVLGHRGVRWPAPVGRAPAPGVPGWSRRYPDRSPATGVELPPDSYPRAVPGRPDAAR